jgi:hypothetical protein
MKAVFVSLKFSSISFFFQENRLGVKKSAY